MTNNQIIMGERIDLMEQGVIGSTGKVFRCIDDTGNEIILDEPEEIHTYQAWRDLGYQVRKGEKAVARFPIWKYTTRRARKEDDEDREFMFMKMSAFFTRRQVDPIEMKGGPGRKETA